MLFGKMIKISIEFVILIENSGILDIVLNIVLKQVQKRPQRSDFHFSNSQYLL